MDRFSKRLQKLRETHQKREEKYNRLLIVQQRVEQENTLKLLTKSMENTRPVGRVEPKKRAEEEESDSSGTWIIDRASSHSEYEPNGSESESSLSPATPIPSSQKGMSTTSNKKKSKITVKCSTKTENGKRIWDKKHFCLYCKKPNTKIARHLERKHCKESDVAQALSFPKRSKQRAALLEEIRNKGNFEHNIEVLENGDGQLITWRQPEANASANDYLPCPQCWGFFVKTDLWKHEISCRIRQVKNTKKTKRIQSHASRLIPVSSSGCKAVLHSMHQDDISFCVRNDPLICKFGDVLFEKHGQNKFQHSYIGQKMRELGRFLIAARAIDKSVFTLQDILVPGKFQTVVNATRTVSGFMASENKYKTPSLACKIGYSLKRAAEILVGESLITGKKSTERDAKKFIEVMDTQWNTYVSGRALNTLKTAKWNKDDMIPLTEDIMKLQKHLKVLEKDALDGLSVAPNVADWTKLCQSLLAQIILFNRRREGEASKLLLATYTMRNRAPAHPEVYESLSKLEKSLVSNFTRLEIRGKRERKVPLLLTHDMTASIDILIRNRSAVGICSENPFVFARTSGTCHMRGSDCLRQFSLQCQAKHPERLRSTKLRKHIATLCQMMNLKNSEMDQVAKFMGHDIRVHREYYRLSENTIQLAKISKLLIAIEKGNHVYSGRSLEELDLDEPLDDEQSDGDEDSCREQSDGECPRQKPALKTTEEQSYKEKQSGGKRPRKKTQEMSVQPRSQKPALENTEEQSSEEQQSDGDEDSCREQSDGECPRQKPALKTTEEQSYKEKQSGGKRPRKKTQEMSVQPRSQKPALENTEEQSSEEQQSAGERPLKKHKMSMRTRSQKPNLETTDDESSDEQQSDCKNRAKPRRPWTNREKQAVWRHLAKYRSLKKVPGKQDCLQCIQAEGDLKTRTWKDVKHFVHNSITTQKRKAGALISKA